MKVMEAVGKGFSIAGRNIGLLAILFVFNVVWNLASLPFLGNIQPPAKLTPTPPLILLSVIFVLLNIFVQGGVFGVLKDAIVSEGKAALGAFAKYGGKFYLRFLGLGLIILSAIALAVLIIGFIFSISLLIKNVIVNIIVVSVVLILAAVALYYIFLIFLSPYALVMDDVGIFKAMKNSLRFVKNNLLKVAALSTILVLIGLGIGFIFGVLTGMLSFALKGATFQVVAGILTSAVNAYITVIISAALMSYYRGAGINLNAPGQS